MKLRINPVAMQDMQDIKMYITSELQNPDAAVKILQKIIAAYKRLPEFPLMGTSLSLVLGIRLNNAVLSEGITLYSTRWKVNIFLSIVCYMADEITSKSFLASPNDEQK